MNLSVLIEILGTFAFSIAGAFAAMHKRLDPFGVLILAFVTAIGGGTVRDVLIGDLPVAWLTDSRTTLVIIGSSIIALFFSRVLHRFKNTLLIFDAAGLGLFTLLGIQKGMAHHLSPGICVALGTITGCFGGVLRDVLLNNVPLIFQREIYASASILGGAVFFILLQLNISNGLPEIIAIISIVLVRLLAVRFRWSLPRIYEK